MSFDYRFRTNHLSLIRVGRSGVGEVYINVGTTCHIVTPLCFCSFTNFTGTGNHCFIIVHRMYHCWWHLQKFFHIVKPSFFRLKRQLSGTSSFPGAIAVFLQLPGGCTDSDTQLSRGVPPYSSFLGAIAPSFLGVRASFLGTQLSGPSFLSPPASCLLQLPGSSFLGHSHYTYQLSGSVSVKPAFRAILIKPAFRGHFQLSYQFSGCSSFQAQSQPNPAFCACQLPGNICEFQDYGQIFVSWQPYTQTNAMH